MMTMHERPIFDTMSAAVCHGLLTRFPKLNIAAIENGGAWVPGFLRQLEDAYRKMPHAFEEDPIAAFKRNVYVSPFHEDDIGELIELLGADHLLFGSDFPHPEGLADPCSYLDHLPAGLADEDVAKIMGGNLGRLMGVEVAV
jgi:predicted TIM-barrel fold metal-dependent hydrolase